MSPKHLMGTKDKSGKNCKSQNPNNRMQSASALGCFGRLGHSKSDTGWMKREIFYEYVSNVFYPSVKKQNIEFSIILFVDGHKTHLNRKLSDLCTELQIVLIALYPNANRIIQPYDVSTFKPLKDGWRKGIVNWKRHHLAEQISKENLVPILKIVIGEVVKPDMASKLMGSGEVLKQNNLQDTALTSGLINIPTEYVNLYGTNVDDDLEGSRTKDKSNKTKIDYFNDTSVISNNKDDIDINDIPIIIEEVDL
ncbi:hypothetical protein ILUMI_12422 [Ignelater luminosus]|uniref:DDE-1 domain-containing protein n=1 Tax=Ignelater luminosus TaxID=2038154 RepID=A0A8K0CWH0_IGNLU|nr:hypothetical protein ILUMI_12422 [Ignelater luminosus]